LGAGAGAALDVVAAGVDAAGRGTAGSLFFLASGQNQHEDYLAKKYGVTLAR
jgi:hypothetical protein